MKLGIIVGFLSLGVWGRRCTNPRVRKEIRELTPNELSRFIRALKIAHSEERRDGLSHFDYFAYIHTKYQEYAHFEPAFLPWHRFYLRQMERKLQSIDPSVMLPYWDWSLDSQEPHNSPVLSNRIFGGRGDPNDGFCIREGPFSDWVSNYPEPHCLRREYDEGEKVSAFATPEAIILDLNEAKFSDFALQFEIKHGYPHANIGGDSGDLLAMHSPNDPLFYLHHTFIDMIWSQWQKRHPRSVQYEGSRYRKVVSLDDLLVPFGNVSVRSTLDTQEVSYCYVYPEYPRVILGPRVPERVRNEVDARNRRNPFFRGGLRNQNFLRIFEAGSISAMETRSLGLLKYLPPVPKLRATRHLSERFIQMNRMDPQEVRNSESRDKFFLNLLNSDVAFSSLAFSQSIANRFI